MVRKNVAPIGFFQKKIAPPSPLLRISILWKGGYNFFWKSSLNSRISIHIFLVRVFELAGVDSVFIFCKLIFICKVSLKCSYNKKNNDWYTPHKQKQINLSHIIPRIWCAIGLRGTFQIHPPFWTLRMSVLTHVIILRLVSSLGYQI